MAEPELFDDAEVTEVYQSHFGLLLFNTYTKVREPRGLLFSARLFVVRRMIRAMLDAEAELGDRRTM